MKNFVLCILSQKRALVALFLILFSACTEPCRQWNYDRIGASCPAYESSRMTLCGSSNAFPLRLVIVHTISGIRMYVDLLGLEAPPDPTDPFKALITITTAEETFDVSAFRFEGGQRLLLPSEDADRLIDLLLNDQTFSLAVGSSRSDVIPNGFSAAYSQLK